MRFQSSELVLYMAVLQRPLSVLQPYFLFVCLFISYIIISYSWPQYILGLKWVSRNPSIGLMGLIVISFSFYHPLSTSRKQYSLDCTGAERSNCKRYYFKKITVRLQNIESISRGYKTFLWTLYAGRNFYFSCALQKFTVQFCYFFNCTDLLYSFVTVIFPWHFLCVFMR